MVKIDNDLAQDLIDYAEKGKVAEPWMVDKLRSCLSKRADPREIKLPERIYLGSQNSILYLIDQKPCSGGSDCPVVEDNSHSPNVFAKIYAEGERGNALGEKLVQAYNLHDEMAALLKRAQGLICLLPGTSETMSVHFDINSLLGKIAKGNVP